MAGSTRSYDATKIILGPGDLWANVAVPAAGARITIDTTSGVHTPDATENPSAKHIGMTKEGCEISYKPNVQDFESDEQTAPFLSRLITEILGIKGELFQVFDWDLLAKMTVGGTRNTTTTYEELTIGGKSSVTTSSIVLIAPDLTSPTTLFIVCQLYKTYNKAGWAFRVTRKQPASLPFEFEALSVTTRAVNDQQGNLWKKIA
jgi:hypothetical protein